TFDASGKSTEEYTEVDPDWKNVLSVRAGGEYMTETSIGRVPIRAGWGYVPLPSPSISTDSGRSRVVSYTASVGTGIHWEQIHLDLAYTFTAYNRDVSDPSVFSSVEYRNRNHHLNLSFTGTF
ncbi:MAG: hypothetical protein AB1744_14530, partial [Candidatus Zixiibacteriota bacterium]